MTFSEFEAEVQKLERHRGNAVWIAEPNPLVRLYTERVCYAVCYRLPSDGDDHARRGYLGCSATAREPNAGETWLRGNDLRDGPFSFETWHNILLDILSYEMQTFVP